MSRLEGAVDQIDKRLGDLAMITLAEFADAIMAIFTVGDLLALIAPFAISIGSLALFIYCLSTRQ